MGTSRARFLEQTLTTLQWYDALRALEVVKREMCSPKYERHDGSHYYYHPIDVAQKLISLGVRDEAIIVGALLHDIVEDVPDYPIGRVRSEFGDNVATMVLLVTKQKGVNYKDERNMSEYLEKISEHYGAALIKTGDRMHNFGTLKNATLAQKKKQTEETKKFFIPFFKTCRNKYPRYAHIFFEAKTSIEPHLWEIEELCNVVAYYEGLLSNNTKLDEAI